MRMGKGKGKRKRKIYFLKKGEILYELRYKLKNFNIYENKKLFKFIINLLLILLLVQLRHKLSVKSRIFKKIL
jgi:hypothetical protein